MKILQFIYIIFFFLSGCADLAENPTDIDNFEIVPDAVLNIIDGNCTSCHMPESQVVFKGQKPYFRRLLTDNTTILDTLQIWQARKRIRIRVSEGTMPRAAATLDIFFVLPQDQIDLIINWAD